MQLHRFGALGQTDEGEEGKEGEEEETGRTAAAAASLAAAAATTVRTNAKVLAPHVAYASFSDAVAAALPYGVIIDPASREPSTPSNPLIL